mmetsp:Transcript_3219/g.5781  ORF Transcript_3219/g.5781 Transcript_3219/m.5781 type:complete len:268 (+) Transcript_3219:89-892(+)
MQLQRVGCVAATFWLIILPCTCEDAMFLPMHGSGDMAHGNMESPHEQRRLQDVNYTNQLAAALMVEFAVLFVVLVLVAPIVFCVGNLIGGLIYSKCPKCRPPLEDARRRSGGPDFEYGLLEGCCQSGHISFWGCCCPHVLWSAMASSPKSRFWGLTFWQMLTLRLGLTVGTLILLVFCPVLVGLLSIPFIVMNVLHRQHLRQKFGLEHSTCSIVFSDVYTWLCCQPCATIQEALQVGYTGDPSLEGPLHDDSARNVPLQMHLNTMDV